MRIRKHTIFLLTTLVSLAAASAADQAGAPSFYRETPLFSTAPDEKKSLNTITRLGPVGMGIDLVQPAFTMEIHNIEPGSPAAAAGVLKAGQIIESINGQKLKDIDPRIQLGRIIEQAEAGDGVITFVVKDKASSGPQEVTVQIPKIGAYSNTWPVKCPKSDKIVRDFADYLARPDSNKGFGGFGMLFLLSTGEEKDVAPVREWVHDLADKRVSGYAWHLGFGGIPLCEYYLRTGDAEALPIIQKWVDAAAAGEYLDAWAGRGGVTKITYGNGHLNAGGTAVVTFLLLAKQCGADVDESLLHRTLVHFFRFAGRGHNPYGDDRPETSFVDNGKSGNLAFAMAAAASLTPEGENSIYARARDICAMNSFYTTTYMLHGHTGGGIGEIWRSAAMGLLRDKKPAQYREFMDERMWHYDMSRRFDGSFGILGGAGYDKIDWGGCYPLAYTVPRKTLRITGAPPSRFSKTYQLPKRPWGTAADDVFLSLEPATDKDGSRQDVSHETLKRDSAKPLIERLNAVSELSDAEISRYVHHPDYTIRNMMANHAAGFTIAYMFNKRGPKLRPGLLEEFVRSNDARVRNAGLRAAAASFDPAADWAKHIFDIAVGRLKDPEESWWVKDAALTVVSRGTPDMIVPHVDLLMPYLKHQEQWLQNGALSALAVVVADERCYRKVLPAVGALIRTCQRISTTGGPVRTIRSQLANAGPDVRKLAIETLQEAYTGYAGIKTWPGGQDVSSVYDSHLEFLAGTLASVPGGYDVLYEIAKERFPNQPLPYAKIFLAADPQTFGPELRKTIGPIISEELIYEYMGRNRTRLLAEASAEKTSSHFKGAMDDLVSLYDKVGVRDYDWHAFGPDLPNVQWDYYTFDPPEKLKYDITPWRYRKVTYPAGMEEWFSPAFDPSRANWKKGLPPFGQYNGQLVTVAKPCGNPVCREHDAMRTFWDKEVLLVRGTYSFPPLKPGHLYRIAIGTGTHVGSGDGYRIYINGRQLVEVKEGIGKRGGGVLRGGTINKAFLDEFAKGPVTIAATTFLRFGDRAIAPKTPVPQGSFSLWLEEMKLPPLDDESFQKSATVIPMLSSDWQMKQDPDNKELQGEDDRFVYDGKFVPDAALLGAWTALAVVEEPEDFDPAAKADARRVPFKEVTFKDGGKTSSPTMIWSGDRLMDLTRYQVLKMNRKTLGDAEYLFVEAGDFDENNPQGWQCPWWVLKKR